MLGGGPRALAAPLSCRHPSWCTDGVHPALDVENISLHNHTPPPSSRGSTAQIQDERSAMLVAAKERGYYEHYSGKRVGFQGTKFTIKEATLFNVSSPTGERHRAGVLRWKGAGGMEAGFAWPGDGWGPGCFPPKPARSTAHGIVHHARALCGV